MTETTAPLDEGDRLLAEFLRDYEEADDPDSVLRLWAARHPQRAETFAQLGRTARLIRGAGAADEPPVPECLGDFRIVRRIGAGGMGVVYEAIQEPFGRRVAVKALRALHSSPTARERFLREQTVLAQLHHTGIVPIFAGGRAGDIDYFAMPFVDGLSLREVIFALRSGCVSGPLDVCVRRLKGQETGAGPGRSAAAVVADVAAAVAHAHARGILHRDLKPANLMLDVDGRVWLLDFGLAGYANDAASREIVLAPQAAGLSMPGTTMGTIDSMAPEQLAGQADVRTDVWGLGTVLYELLALQRPYAISEENYTPESAVARRQRELAGALVPADRLASGCPRDLAAICARCLEKSPERRYPSAAAVAEDLRRHLRGDETSVRPWGPTERALRWARRQPVQALWAAVGAAFLLLLTLAVGHASQFRTATDRETDRLARSLHNQLLAVADTLREVARDDPRLAEALAQAEGESPELSAILRQVRNDTHRLRFQRPGETEPTFNWFAMNRAGVIVADTSPAPPHKVVGQSFAYRNYARPLQWPIIPEPPRDVHVSTVFRSRQDDHFKFAVTTPVRLADGTVVGLLAATVPVGDCLVGLNLKNHMDDEETHLLIAAPTDRRGPDGEDEPAGAGLPRFARAFSPLYGERGAALLDADEWSALLARFEKEEDVPSAARTRWRGGRLIYVRGTRVGATPLVAVIERPYPWDANLLVWSAAAIVGLVLMRVVFWLGRVARGGRADGGNRGAN